MIFIGDGSLLKNAINFTVSKNYRIDTVFSNTKEVKVLCDNLNIPFRSSVNINGQISHFKCTDDIVFSINNDQIIKDPLLSKFKFFNIHNGVVPAYRGLPEICIIYAILNREIEYGVSFHQIDWGIDTGRCYHVKKFPITDKDTFQSIMLKSIKFCEEIFNENLDKVVHNKLNNIALNSKISRLYGYDDLKKINGLEGADLLKRAFYFGVFKPWYKKAWEIWEKKTSTFISINFAIRKKIIFIIYVKY